MSESQSQYSSSSDNSSLENKKIYEERLQKFLKQNQCIIQVARQQKNTGKVANQDSQKQSKQIALVEYKQSCMQQGNKFKDQQILQEELTDLTFRLQAYQSEKEGILSAHLITIKERIKRLQVKIGKIKLANLQFSNMTNQFNQNKLKEKQINFQNEHKIRNKSDALMEKKQIIKKYKIKANKQFNNLIQMQIYPFIKYDVKQKSNQQIKQIQLKKDIQNIKNFLIEYVVIHKNKLSKICAGVNQQIQVINKKLRESQKQRIFKSKKLNKSILEMEQKLNQLISIQTNKSENSTTSILKEIQKSVFQVIGQKTNNPKTQNKEHQSQ